MVVRLANETTYAVVSQSARQRESERERKTCSHSAGTGIRPAADTCIYFSLGRNESAGQFFSIWTETRMKNKIICGKKKKVVR